jgi:hypothetical protein
VEGVQAADKGPGLTKARQEDGLMITDDEGQGPRLVARDGMWFAGLKFQVWGSSKGDTGAVGGGGSGG